MQLSSTKLINEKGCGVNVLASLQGKRIETQLLKTVSPFRSNGSDKTYLYNSE